MTSFSLGLHIAIKLSQKGEIGRSFLRSDSNPLLLDFSPNPHSFPFSQGLSPIRPTPLPGTPLELTAPISDLGPKKKKKKS